MSMKLRGIILRYLISKLYYFFFSQHLSIVHSFIDDKRCTKIVGLRKEKFSFAINRSIKMKIRVPRDRDRRIFSPLFLQRITFHFH